MNDDVEDILRQQTPPGPAPELRAQVLDAVAGELRRGRDGGWLRRCALAAAAAWLLSVGLSFWADRATSGGLDRVLGPRPPQREAMELAADIASVTDPETSRWFYQYAVSRRQAHNAYQYFESGYRRILNRE